MLGLAIALAAAGCARQQQGYYVVDPQTGQPVFARPAYQPPAVQSADNRGLFSSSPHYAQASPGYAQPGYAQPAYAQPAYAQPAYQPQPTQSETSDRRGLFSSSPAYAQQYYEPAPAAQPAYQAAPAPRPSSEQPRSAQTEQRGLFNTPGFFAGRSRAPAYAQQPAYAPAPQQSAPQYAPQQPQYTPAPRYTGATGGPYAAAPAPAAVPASAVAVPVAVPANYQPVYTLDSGDRLRIVVYGQEGITSSYIVGADGYVNLPLIGAVPARGFSTQQLSKMIAERLKQGYVREPHVSVEVEVYRPFFILGEVTTPGQYPFVANMTAETAVAIAGGFSPRADKRQIILTHNSPGQPFRGPVPLNYPVRPGDTVLVKERWF